MKTASLVCEIIVILVQMFHTYWIMDYGSGLKDKARFLGRQINPKAIQAWLFCGILDTAFLFSMIDGLIGMAYSFIGILTAINIFYVYNTVQDMKGDKRFAEQRTSPRVQLVRYFNVIMINFCTFIFAFIYVKA